jgi:hypothetical protein
MHMKIVLEPTMQEALHLQESYIYIHTPTTHRTIAISELATLSGKQTVRY